jgi:hypothetical protein
MLAFLRIYIVYFIFAFTANAYAQALPVSVNKYGQALSRLISIKAGSRGFAVNDPRYGATTVATGVVATAIGAAGAAVVVGATAPAWVTVAAGAVIASIAGVAIDMAMDSGAKWIWSDDGKTITVPANGSGTVPMVAGGAWYEFGSGDSYAYGADPAAVLTSSLSASDAAGGNVTHVVLGCSGTGAGVSCSYTQTRRDTGEESGVRTTGLPYHATGAPGSCSGVVIAGSCKPGQGSTPKNGSLADAAALLTPAQLASPVNPDILAGAANELWRRAAVSPGYAHLVIHKSEAPNAGAEKSFTFNDLQQPL